MDAADWTAGVHDVDISSFVPMTVFSVPSSLIRDDHVVGMRALLALWRRKGDQMTRDDIVWTIAARKFGQCDTAASRFRQARAS